MLLVAVDIGGTFTDLMAYDGERRRIFQGKSLTTPDNLVRGVLDCVAKSGVSLRDVSRLIHGSTIAINTLIERKGARTALLVTKGTRDAYAIGRGNRPDAYNLKFSRPRPLLPRQAIYEVDERMLAGGAVHKVLEATQVEGLADEIRGEEYEAVAVCFLHSYANIAHEAQAGEILADSLPGVYVSRSHDILREYREYERISTTVVNAYVGPKVSGYVRRLAGSLDEAGFAGELAIMQSNGGVMSPEVAARQPVMMIESGPVGGIIAGAAIANALGHQNVISFDMGGTTAKASLILNATAEMAEGYYVGGYDNGDPVMVPVVDVFEVGTGGGSIARIDSVGALKVGPESAGAAPGPIAYGRGGTRPTITDANVVLGRIGASDFLGGEMPLDRDAALDGIAREIGDPLGMTGPAAAQAIIDIAVAQMSLAVRQVSVKRGHDPRTFALVASGGAGPVHAIAIARDLHIPTVIIPNYPSHFSALGMLLADERHDLVRTHLVQVDQADFGAIGRIIAELAEEARGRTRGSDPAIGIMLDMRYVGQEFSLTVPVDLGLVAAGRHAEIRAAFDRLHEQRYAHSAPDEPVEIVNIRLVATASGAKPQINASEGHLSPPSMRPVHFGSDEPVMCPVYRRDSMSVGSRIEGPALVLEYGSTSVLHPGDACLVAETGELIVTLRS